MRTVIFVSVVLILVMSAGCVVTEESVGEINQKIEDRYNSFSTLKYTIIELRYENGVMTQKQEYTEMFKKPDKKKQIFYITEFTLEYVADRIVTHAVRLVDAYVNELPAPTSVFPNGSFEFTLDNDVEIGISPGFINGRVYRVIEFAFPDNRVQAIVLDGPVYEPPGDIKPELVAEAKKRVEGHLLGSEMMVKRIFKDDVRLNLSKADDYKTFIQLIYDSIHIENNTFGYNPDADNLLHVCNGNTLYSQLTLSLVNVYEYVNLPPEMTTYCGYYINKGAEKWKIPMELTDETKYDVETSIVDYNGEEAIKAEVTVLMSEEAKQKQIAAGKTPRETVVTYWFDPDDFAILKEESHSYITTCEVSEVVGGETQAQDCEEKEIKVERVYEGFYFDSDIPDSEFEVNPADYPDVEFIEETVDVQEKFD